MSLVTGAAFDARIGTLASSLLVVSEGAAPALPECVREVRALLGADVAVTCAFAVSDAGVVVDRLPTGSGTGERLRCALALLCEGTSAVCPLATACPSTVATLDQTRRALPADTAEELRRSLAGSGLGRHDVARVLLSHEGAPLACVALLRGYRFDDVELRGLERVADALGRRLRFERRVRDPHGSRSALPAAMAAIGAPAFLARPGGEVVHANPLGGARLAARRDETREAIAAACAGRAAPGVEATRVRSPGLPEHWLVVLRSTEGDVEGRARQLAARWALTPRQREVLAQLASGASNKDIGARLVCAESTVEQHVTRILQRSGCASRAQLVAEFWRSG